MDVFATSQVSSFYDGKNIFITGGTGFLGKSFIEKVLRACPNVGNIYMLCRGKRGKSPSERLTDLFEKTPLYENLRANNPDCFKKVIPVIGDIMEKNLGLSEEDEKLITENVNIMIHSAATIRFDDHIKVSLRMNLGGTVKMVQLARKVKNLVSYVHVSTAYANCNLSEMDEIHYEMGEEYNPLKLLELCDWMDENVLASMTKTLLGDRPNSYCLTKALAEEYLFKHATDLPLGIFRPSIISSAWQEPAPGWVDNYNGPTGLFIAVGKGVLRVVEGDSNKRIDIIPIDFCVNMLISISWYTPIIKKQVEKPLIYHCTSGSKKPYTWWQIGKAMVYHFRDDEPFDELFRRPDIYYTTSKIEVAYWQVISHWIPAYCVEALAKITRNNGSMLRVYEKVHKATDTFKFFINREWTWTHRNCDMLMTKMSDNDKKTFNFNVSSINMNEYFINNFRGAKKYLGKEDVSPEASKACVTREKRKEWFFFLLKIMLAVLLGRHLVNNTAVCRNLWINTLQLVMSSLQYIKLTIGWAPSFLTDYIATSIEQYASVTTQCSVLCAVLYTVIGILLLPAVPYCIKRQLIIG